MFGPTKWNLLFNLFNYLSRSRNQFPDALSTLVSMLKISEETDICPITVETWDELAYCHNVEVELDGNPWFYDIKMFLEDDS